MIALAEVAPTELGTLVLGLGVVLNLALNALAFIRQAGGKGGERQVEPTAIAALSDKLEEIQANLNHDSEARGRLDASVEQIRELLEEQRVNQRRDIERAHNRIDELSREVSRHSAKIEHFDRLVK